MHHLRGLVPPDQIPCPLEGLSAFGGGPQDCKIKQGRYPTTPLANRCEILSPRLTRLGSGAREALIAARHQPRTDRGAGGGHVQMSNASLVPPCPAPSRARGLQQHAPSNWHVPPDQSALAIHCHGSLRCGTRGALRARNYRAWSIRPDFHAALQQDIAAACLARQAETGPYPPTPFGFWESDLGGNS